MSSTKTNHSSTYSPGRFPHLLPKIPRLPMGSLPLGRPRGEPGTSLPSREGGRGVRSPPPNFADKAGGTAGCPGGSEEEEEGGVVPNFGGARRGWGGEGESRGRRRPRTYPLGSLGSSGRWVLGGGLAGPGVPGALCLAPLLLPSRPSLFPPRVCLSLKDEVRSLCRS